VVSSQLLGGLSIKETLRFVLVEIESLRTSVLEIEAVKSRLSLMETLQQEILNLPTKFQEMSHDYVGMTQQVRNYVRISMFKSLE
jgi:septum formation topological specificity factor MinE